MPSADLSHVCAVAPEPWYCWSYSTCSSHWNPIGILLPLAFCLKTLPEIELRNDIGKETVEALGSLLPRD